MAVQMGREDLERLMFFEQAREQAEQDWKKNNKDAQALTRWGGALLELAHFHQGPKAVELINLSVEKFEAAVAVKPDLHEAHWCLGNALTSQGFLQPDGAVAQDYFDKAKVAFTIALEADPNNAVYKKALELTAKAPSLHAELQKQLQAQSEMAAAAGGGRASAAAGGGKATAATAQDDDWFYDYVGWGVLGAALVGFAVWSASVSATASKR